MDSLGTISELIVKRLEKYGPSDNIVASCKLEAIYVLQKALGKTEVVDVEDESNYEGLEKIIIADVAAYKILKVFVTSLMVGDSGGNIDDGSRIKKGSVGQNSALVEFDYVNSEDGNNLLMGSKDLLSCLAENVCISAKALCIRVPGFCEKKTKTTIKPFIFVRKCENY